MWMWYTEEECSSLRSQFGPGDRVINVAGRSDLRSRIAYVLPDPKIPGQLKKAKFGCIWVVYEEEREGKKPRLRKLQWRLWNTLHY